MRLHQKPHTYIFIESDKQREEFELASQSAQFDIDSVADRLSVNNDELGLAGVDNNFTEPPAAAVIEELKVGGIRASAQALQSPNLCQSAASNKAIDEKPKEEQTVRASQKEESK